MNPMKTRRRADMKYEINLVLRDEGGRVWHETLKNSSIDAICDMAKYERVTIQSVNAKLIPPHKLGLKAAAR